jgi:hypothetical protein
VRVNRNCQLARVEGDCPHARRSESADERGARLNSVQY